MDLRTAEIPPGERLAVEADGSDRDSDQVDDLVVHVSLEGAPTPLVATTRASTQIRFLGREGGLSREAGDPGQALGAAARWQASLSSKKTHEEALVAARQIRRLHAHVCAEGGAPTLTLGDGTAGNNVLLGLAVGAQTWTNNSATQNFTINNSASSFARVTGATLA